MYTPPQVILERYADVLINYALNGSKGLKKGETVWLVGNEYTKPLYREVLRAIWKAGGNVITQYQMDEMQRYGANRDLLEIGTDAQLSFFPEKYFQGIVDSCDHILFILSDPDIHALEGISAKKVEMMNNAIGPFMAMRGKAEAANKMFWALCLYGTESSAAEAGLTLEEYWEEIINACFLHYDDPIAKWREVKKDIEKTKKRLNALAIKSIHLTGDDIDLHIKIGNHRQWLGASGHNIPSFEIFTSPDWRGTNGWIRFNQPIYYEGKKIVGAELSFDKGIVIDAKATQNNKAFLEMLAQDGANRVGEFSLTDIRHSRINRFMANTLYDENYGGEYGNTHIAIGRSFPAAYKGSKKPQTPAGWMRLGFNQAQRIHTDMISTSNRVATAELTNGKRLVIYKDGQFTI